MTKLALNIKHTVEIQNGKVLLDNQIVFENRETETFQDFFKTLYQNLGLSYSKFYKMDALSKLGFLSFEYLMQQVDQFDNLDKDKIGIFLANDYSSLDTDEQYWASAQGKDAHPSPKLFVYTLPNIVIGEICIKHKIKSEHAFLVSNSFDSEFISNYVKDLFDRGIIETGVVGWLELYRDQYQSKLYWVEK